MSPLTKKLLRDLMANKAQVMAVIVVIGLGVALFTGVFFSARSMGDSVHSFYSEMNYDDFFVSVESATPGITKEAKELRNVSAVQGRLVTETLGKAGDASLTIRVITVPDSGRPSVNDVMVLKGGYLEVGAGGVCLIEYHLAKEFKLKPGDSISLAGEKGQSKFRISGIVASPEYLRMTSKSELFADPRQLGVVFITSSEAERLFGAQLHYNEILFRVDNRKYLAATMESAESLLKPFNVLGVKKGEEWGSAAWTDLDIQNQRNLAGFFGPLFLMVAALTLFVAITRQVVLQQRQIGISRALGFEKKSMLLHYMGYGAVPGLLGSMLGILGGFLMGKFVVHLMTEALGTPPIYVSKTYWDIAILGVFTGIAFSVLGAILPAWRASRMKPCDAIRADADIGSVYKPRYTKKRGRITSGTPSWLYLSIRNIVKNKRRALLTGFAIMMTVAMILSLSATMRSVSYSMDIHFNEVWKWQVRAVLQKPQTPDRFAEISAIKGVETAEPGIVFPAHVVSGGGSADIEIQALPENTVMHRSLDYGVSRSWPGPGEVVLHKGLKGKLGVKPGGRVRIQTELGAVEAKVAGYVDELFGNIGYMNLEYVRGLVGADVFNNAYLLVDPSMEEEVYGALVKVPGVAKVVTKKQVVKYGDILAEVLLTFGNMMLYIGFFMGLGIIFTMVSINVLERSRELGTMRTLGAGGGMIFGLLNIETLFICLTAFVPGVVIGRVLEWFLIHKVLSRDFLSATSKLSIALVLAMLAGLLLAAFLSELLPFRSIMRLDLARATRERQGS